ncbi:MAG: thioredoxin-like domain-containing protein [Pyrinomonadaceae bacterium]
MREQAKVRAPELTGGKGWLNTDRPLSLAGLKGKMVLLDFWTYGCINCIHIIPDLKRLESRYENKLVVIGVHSAKFDNEKETENIRRIILRYGIEHPVINDADFKIWDAYSIRAWPGLVLIDPAGYVIGTWFGEGRFNEIDALAQKTVEEFRSKGALDEKPIAFALERAKVGNLPLSFPGKVLADEKSARLFIADSNHNRIVVTDLSGKLIETIGAGRAGLKDGGFDDASFNKPQGMALDGDFLYVADTENHSIRRVDLKNKRVARIAGTGNLFGFTGSGGPALETSLRSPWDLSLVGRDLFIAMAGSHQIWRLDLKTGEIGPYAGSRVEARIDGPLGEAGFAQPSGIVADGKHLFVADSESNIIREIDFETSSVETLVGGDLFYFGDVDGRGDSVRLQHPLGIELYDGDLLLADTYNHKIKILDPEKRTVQTFLGTGEPGQKDGTKPSFYEPGGISVAGGKLFVADTNNQAIRVVDLKTRETSTLKIDGLAPPAETTAESDAGSGLKTKPIGLETKEIEADSAGSLIVKVDLPEGFHLNPNAPQRYEVSVEGGENVKLENPRQKFRQLPVVIPFKTGAAGAATLRADLTIYYCREDNTGVCLIKSLSWNVPLKVVKKAGKTADRIELTAKVE